MLGAAVCLGAPMLQETRDDESPELVQCDGLVDQDGWACWSFNKQQSLPEVVPSQCILGSSEKGQGFGCLV